MGPVGSASVSACDRPAGAATTRLRVSAVSRRVLATGTPRVLLRAAVARTTADRYGAAVKEYRAYLRAEGWAQPEDAAGPEEIDDSLSEWMEDLYERYSGKRKQTAANGLYGLLHEYPRLKGKLPTAERSFDGWAKKHPAKPHPPLGPDVMAVIAMEMAFAGDCRAAAQTVVAFHCLLRISELAGLTVADVGLPGSATVSGAASVSSMYLRLRRTKTGAEQHVVVTSDDARRCVLWCMSGRAAYETLFVPGNVYRRRLALSCARLRLPVVYVPHSLRHGGATYLYTIGVPISTVMVIGRWKQSASAVHYIQSGRNLWLDHQHDPDLLALGRVAFKMLFTAIGVATNCTAVGQSTKTPLPLTATGSAARRTQSRTRSPARRKGRPPTAREASAAAK